MEESKPIGVYLTLLGKHFKTSVHEECDKVNINGTYSSIIMVLSRNKEGISQNMIAERSRLAGPTVSLTLRNMEQEGLIEKCVCSNDSRKVIVKLTKKGLEIDEKIGECFRKVEEQMEKDISKEEILQFKNIINKMTLNLGYEVIKDV